MVNSIKRDIKIIDSKAGLKTLSVNNIFIHSKYNPSIEAERFIENNKACYEGKKHIVIYGLGLGYYVKELLKRTEIDCNIYVFDLDKEVYEIAKESGLLKEIQEDKRVHFYIGNNPCFYDNLKEKLSLVEDMLIINQIVRVIPKEYDNIKNLLKDFEMAKTSIKLFGDEMKENYRLNMKLNEKEITEFLNKNNDSKPILIVSAGPSLDLVLEDIKNLRDRFRIFAVGRALKPLIINKIKPDMICAIDSQDYVYEQIKGYENLDIPFCFLSTSNHRAVSKYQGPKYIFFNEDLGFNTKIATGKSVATAVLDIAIKCKGNPIIFVGQDLAYLNNKAHSEASCYSMGSNNISKNNNYKEVLGVTGEMLKTTEGFLSFKRWIENKIRENPNLKFINCSGGAKLQGTLEISIKDIDGVLKNFTPSQ